MNKKISKILVLDPFLGQSHLTFWKNLQLHSAHEITIHPYTQKYWKLSSGLSSLSTPTNLDSYNLFLVSDYFDIASFKGLNRSVADIPFICYFHENQFEYPISKITKKDEHFALLNLRNYLASDLNIFNSNWNRKSLLNGVNTFRKRLPSTHRKMFPK